MKQLYGIDYIWPLELITKKQISLPVPAINYEFQIKTLKAIVTIQFDQIRQLEIAMKKVNPEFTGLKLNMGVFL